MRALTAALRRQLETSVLAARRAAEAASAAALESLGTFADRRPQHLGPEQAALRNGLRAKWRQLGKREDLLVAECAYEQWHKLLFARFLAENGLLLHPQFKAPVTLADCEDLAAGLGEPDGWSVAARFAAEILPGIFRLDDPCTRLRLAPEGRQALEEILDGIPAEAFAAGDALGWVYQFWQRDKKDEINAAERKIGGADLGPVTQLFTENYMVRFLLENSLGAWWAARRPGSPLLAGFEYLRRDEDGQPASGPFPSWPESVAEVTVMDPCCGSGHFLVEAFSILWRMRAEEEGLEPVEAQDAVLRDNLFGLELDSRCVQIAMFAIALAAWKAGGGWRQLPVPNIACSGIPVKAPVEEWTALADGAQRLESALSRLHRLFRDADSLGSLVDPAAAAGSGAGASLQQSLGDVEWSEAAPALQRALRADRGSDVAASVLGSDLRGLVRAADLLVRDFTLVATNVPFLSRSKQAESLRSYLDARAPRAKGDLATAMLERWLGAARTLALVSPQNWQEKPGYTAFRKSILERRTYDLFARVGNNVWQTQSGRQPFKVPTVLSVLSGAAPAASHSIAAIDVGNGPVAEKPRLLAEAEAGRVSQAGQLGNPDSRIVTAALAAQPLLEKVASARQGIKTGDDPRYRRLFWEVPLPDRDWCRFQSSVVETEFFGGRSSVLRWEQGAGTLVESPKARVQGQEAWGKRGVLVSQMGDLCATLYTGERFDSNAAAVVPNDPADLGALWAFLSSPEYRAAVREIDNNVAVTNRTLVKVPFDAERWRQAPAEAGPLPEPGSEDPTQWLFEGRPEASTAPLQVAVARLVGYRWPEQGEDDLDSHVDADGIVCLPSVATEAPAADRLQRLLATAFGQTWSPAKTRQLLEQAGSGKKDLGDWLRDEFFKQHCALFKNRPFVWHVWDGRRDGFAALVDYHRLDRRTLEKLTYTYLGQDWVERQRAAVNDDVPGAEDRLTAALELQGKLKQVLDGEAPYDVYVRWKGLREQPLGWDPDLNDGVRLNVRPFVEAGVLRARLNVHWRKDRGRDADGSERRNDLHLSLAEKRAAKVEERAA
ncbi:MAG: DNA methyltransferase [Solirubrobacterales bacterium]